MEKIIKELTELIRDELSKSQINKDNKSAEYRLGKNEAYLKILVFFGDLNKESNTITGALSPDTGPRN
jgi:hypothetical protein